MNDRGTLSPRPPHLGATLAFYDCHCEEYFASTAHVDMGPLYEPFLRELPRGASILDAGCGSGRDTKAFAERGYLVTAIDGSARLVELAAAFTGQSCTALAFHDIAFHDAFDGIWACASLVHVPEREAPDVIGRFTDALKPGGVLYVSLKDGGGERTADDGRFFCDYTADRFRKVIAGVPALRQLAVWTTEDVRSSPVSGRWLNVLLKKIS